LPSSVLLCLSEDFSRCVLHRCYQRLIQWSDWCLIYAKNNEPHLTIDQNSLKFSF
jgi:hypothetical protein